MPEPALTRYTIVACQKVGTQFTTLLMNDAGHAEWFDLKEPVYLASAVEAERDRLLAASDRMVLEARAAEKRAVDRLQDARVEHIAIQEKLLAEVARLTAQRAAPPAVAPPTDTTP